MLHEFRAAASLIGGLTLLLASSCANSEPAPQDSAEDRAVAPAEASAPAAPEAPEPVAAPQEPVPPAPPVKEEPPAVQEPAAAQPEPGIGFETKLPPKPDVTLVYAHEAGEAADPASFEERVRRALIYIAAGNYLNLVALETLLDEEAARRAAAGERVGGENVTEEQVLATVQQQVDAFSAQAPNADFWRMRLVEGYAPDHYNRTVRLVLRVVDMFFPQDPDLWNVAHLKSVFDAGGQMSNWAAIEQYLDSVKKMKAEGQPLPAMPSDFILSYVMLPGVFAWMRANATIETPVAGLPEGVAMRVNGRDLKTADLLEQIRPLVSGVVEEQAGALVGLLDAIEQDLRGRKKWLSRATLDAFWEAERAGYEGTIFTHEQTVTELLGFPSLEIYRRYFDARQSYRWTLPDPLPAEMLAKEIADRGSFLGLGRVDAQVILLGAVDKTALEYVNNPRLFKPGADPFADARARAQEVAQQLQDGETFESLLLGYSDYPPRVPGTAANALQRDRGRFGLLTRADLRSLLNESDYTDFLSGFSIGDDMFFHAEPNAVYGPTEGPLGSYIYRVLRRTPPTRAMDPEADPTLAYQLEEDLVTQSFLAFVNGLR